MNPNLEAILMAADTGYEDEDAILRVAQYLPKTFDAVDGLAEFVAREIVDTFDEDATLEEQIAEAAKAMQEGASQIAGVFYVLSRLNESKIREFIKIAKAKRAEEASDAAVESADDGADES